MTLMVQTLPTPSMGDTVWAFGLSEDFVPATSLPPATARPHAPVEAWWWQFLAVETGDQDTLATRVRIDCADRTFALLSHAAVKDGRITSTEPSLGDPPVAATPGSILDRLIIHACDPDPDRAVRRYTNYFTARETLDEYYAGR